MPRWSPRGNEIAFLCSEKDGINQIFEVHPDGSGLRQVTHNKNGVEQLAWSPTGDRLAFTAPDDPIKFEGLFDIHNDGLLIKTPPVPTHLWLIASKGGAATRLTHGSWSVLENAAPFVGAASAPSWSADGKRIVFAKQANADDSDTDLSRIAVVNVGSREVTELTNATTYEYQPAFAPKGNGLAYLRPCAQPLSREDVWGGPASAANQDLSKSLDREATAFAFEPGGHGVLAQVDDHLLSSIYAIHPGAPPAKLDLGNLSVDEFAVGKTGAIAFVGSTSTAAGELYLLDREAGKPRRLTQVNARIDAMKFHKAREISWTSGPFTADGVLTYPDLMPGKKYPLVVWAHGGPEAASQTGFISGEQRLMRQLLASQGFIVFEPNYRGSDNLGNAYERATFGDPGQGPGDDILSGVDFVVKGGLVDTSRITMAGHSCGGCMTAWLIGQDHRWRCAVEADGVVDWVSEYNCSNSGNLAFSRDTLGGTPMGIPDLYRTGSAITYAGQVTTPTLVITGLDDAQVPYPQAFAFYHALRDRHVPVRLIGLPGSQHSPNLPVQMERYMEVMDDWILERNR
jgi:dipeptidyl aminopeptidase/acylaminoacyl peptidase